MLAQTFRNRSAGFNVQPSVKNVVRTLLIFLQSGLTAIMCFFWASDTIVNPVLAANDELYYIHTEHLGSTTVVTDEAGGVVNQKRHYPYGSPRVPPAPAGGMDNGYPISCNRSLVTERHFTGQIKDRSTALHYYNARYYDPVLATFTSADTAGERFAYANGNPVMNTDPTGHMVDSRGAGFGYDSGQPPTSQGLGSGGPYLPTVLKSSSDYYNAYKSPYFEDLLKDYLSQHQEVADILAGNYPTYPTRQIWELSKFVNSFEANALNSVSTARQRVLEQQFVVTSQAEENPNLPNVLIKEIADYWYFGNRLSVLRAREEMIREAGDTLPPKEVYRFGLIRCYQRADLLSTYMQKHMPEIPVYAAGGPGHAFVIYEGVGGNFMLVDPTGVLGSEDHPTMPLPLSRAIQLHPNFGWSNLGYNSGMSSPLANEEQFQRGIQDAILGASGAG